jgi:dihydroorotate dehydrogenase (NAD+) catalytic subunit
MGGGSAGDDADAPGGISGGALVAGVTFDLSVDLGGFRLPSPVLVAAGCFGTGVEVTELVDLATLGGIVTRTITLEPAKGTPTPRLAETPSGMVSAVGLQNPGVEAFLSQELPRLAALGVPVIVSVAGRTYDEFVSAASALAGRPEVLALEAYLPARDEEAAGRPYSSRPDIAADIVGSVARVSALPVFAKLPGTGTDLVETASACVRAGAHGITLIDGVPGMAVDADRLAPSLGPVAGALSGPAIHPIALRAVFEVSRALPGVPIMGVGGVRDGIGAVEMLLAGASAVQVGTAMLVDPSTPALVTEGIRRYLESKGLRSAADIRGRLRAPSPQASAGF